MYFSVIHLASIDGSGKRFGTGSFLAESKMLAYLIRAVTPVMNHLLLDGRQFGRYFFVDTLLVKYFVQVADSATQFLSEGLTRDILLLGMLGHLLDVLTDRTFQDCLLFNRLLFLFPPALHFFSSGLLDDVALGNGSLADVGPFLVVFAPHRLYTKLGIAVS